MADIRQAYHICIDALRRCMVNPRIYISLILVIVLMQPLISPIGKFAEWAEIPSSPWLFPFLAQHYYIQTIMLFGVVLLFCDAPFINEGTPYLLIRAGRKNWFWGQIGYIFFASLIYFLLIIAASILLLAPHVALGMEWGKILKTLGLANASLQVGTEQLDASLQAAYAPMQAMFISLLASWMNGVLIGVVIFFANLIANRSMGPITGALLSALPYFAVNGSNIKTIYYFVPSTWMDIMRINSAGMPSFLYAALFLGIAISSLIVLSYLSIRKRAIDVLPSI